MERKTHTFLRSTGAFTTFSAKVLQGTLQDSFSPGKGRAEWAVRSVQNFLKTGLSSKPNPPTTSEWSAGISQRRKCEWKQWWWWRLLSYISGHKEFSKDVKAMIKRGPYKYFVVCWVFVSPLLLVVWNISPSFILVIKCIHFYFTCISAQLS